MLVTKLLSFLLLSIAVAQVRAEVVQLTSANISRYLNDHVTFVKFYSDWCPHCRKFAPVWTKYAELKKNTDLRVAEVDCSEDPLLCSDHDVFGYPTIKLFIRGSGARYLGSRIIESLDAFYQEKIAENANAAGDMSSKSAVTELTVDNFESMTAKDFAFVVFFAPWCKHCKILKPVFQELGKQMQSTKGLLFATVDCTTQHNLCSKHAVRGYPTLIWFENGLEKDRYVQEREVNVMRSYIEHMMKDAKPSATQPPPVVHKSEPPPSPPPPPVADRPSSDERLLDVKTFTQGVSFEGYAFVNFGAPWCSHCQKLAPIWKQLAHRFAQNDDIRIARVDCTASESVCRDYGIRAFPTLILFRYGESKVEYNGARDYDAMYNFLAGQLEFFGDEYLLTQDK